MNTDVFQDFLEKNVEVSTNNKTYEGILTRDAARGVVIVTPSNKYTAKRFGPAMVDQNAITSIRAVHKREEKSIDDWVSKDDSTEDKQIGYFQSSDSKDCDEESAG
jgi:hypothetical protein